MARYLVQALLDSLSEDRKRRDPMGPGEWNGNHNDQAFPMVGVPA
jgi:hypothetical protein